MQVQPRPLANRSTPRCWVRERACLRLMLFLFPVPNILRYHALRCAAGGGMGEIGLKESELRVDAVLGSCALGLGKCIMVVVERVKASYATAGLEKGEHDA